MEDLKNVLKESLEYYIDQEKIIVSRLSVLAKGRIKKKNINGDTYYYLQYRKSSKVVDQYIGKEIPEDLSEDLTERKQLETQLKTVREAIKLLNKKNDKET